ncbi:hypothetical protein BN1088_1432349 [Sphingobacterium sp. PM2-P1-29]|nr:hypothetical protein BN1088_1432349 [Sphingobacterium sp. PM2-P1-29]
MIPKFILKFAITISVFYIIQFFKIKRYNLKPIAKYTTFSP